MGSALAGKRSSRRGGRSRHVPTTRGCWRSKRRRRSHRAFDLEVPLTTSQGRARWVRVLGQPQRDAHGRIVRLSGAVQDVTQVRAADAALQAASEALAQKSQILQLTLDSINQGIVSMNAQNRATVYNRRMLELLDLPESLFGPGKTFDDVGKGYGPAWIFDAKTAVVAQAKSKTNPKPGLLRTVDAGKTFERCADYSTRAPICLPGGPGC